MSGFNENPRSLKKLQTLQECVCLLDTMKGSLSINNMELRTKIKTFENTIDSILKEDVGADSINIFQIKCDLIECLKFEENPELSITKLEACPNVLGTPQRVDIDLAGDDLSERGIIEQKLLKVCQIEKNNLLAKICPDDPEKHDIVYRCEANIGCSAVYNGIDTVLPIDINGRNRNLQPEAGAVGAVANAQAFFDGLVANNEGPPSQAGDAALTDLNNKKLILANIIADIQNTENNVHIARNPAHGQSIVKLADDARVSVANSGKAQVGFIETEKDGLQPVERGIMHIPLWECKAACGKKIYGSVSDISDPILAARFGAIFAPTLLDTPGCAMEDLGHICEDSIISNIAKRETAFCGLETPGLTARTLEGIAQSSGKLVRDVLKDDPAWHSLTEPQRQAVNLLGDPACDVAEAVKQAAGMHTTSLGPSPNSAYSDMKKFTVTRNNKEVVIVVNLPIIAWGDEVHAYPGHKSGPGEKIDGTNRLDNGTQYVVDFGGKDPTIRGMPPNPLSETRYEADGPPPCPDDGITPLAGRVENRNQEGAMERYKGGQCLGINTSCDEKTYSACWFRDDDKGQKRATAVSERAGIVPHRIAGRTAIWKIHKGIFLNAEKASYYTVFAASRPSAAGFMGVPLTPKQNFFGRGKDVKAVGTVAIDNGDGGGHGLKKEDLLPVLAERGAEPNVDYFIEPQTLPDNNGNHPPNPNAGEVFFTNGQTIPRISQASATLVQFANGLLRQDGGPNRFQPGIIPFTAEAAAYTPMWHVNFAFLNAYKAECSANNNNSNNKLKLVVENGIPPANRPSNNPNVDGLLLTARNVSAGGPPPTDNPADQAASDLGHNKAHPATFDDMQTVCGSKDLCAEDFARKLSEKHGAGTEGVLDSGTLGMIQARNEVMLTEAPPGAKQGWQKFLLVNCPIPVSLDIRISNCGVYRDGYKDTNPTHNKYYNTTRQSINNNKYQVIPHDKPIYTSKAAALPSNYELKGDSEQQKNSREAYVIITDSSDEGLATKYNAIFAPSLKEAPNAACELNVGFTESNIDDKNAGLALCEDPGTVSYVTSCGIPFPANGGPIINNPGDFIPPMFNINYSPLKRFTKADGTCVTINCSTVYWKKALADDATKVEVEVNEARQYIVDKGGCDARIRGIPPSPFVNTTNPAWPQAGPPGCTEKEKAINRYKGGQALDINIENQTALWKLHEATFTPQTIPYYTVFEASSPPAAQFMGVVQAPKLGHLGRGTKGIATMNTTSMHGINLETPYQIGDELRPNPAVATLWQFANGINQPAGGPNRFQPGIVPFAGNSANYTPQWHINFILYNMANCTPVGEVAALGHTGTMNDDVIYQECPHIQFGDVPGPTQPPSFRGPSSLPVFDPFQACGNNVCGCSKGVTLKGAHNPDWVNAETVNSTFGPGKLDQATMNTLIEKGKLTLTEAAPGARLFGDKFLVVNCPLPFQIKKSKTQVFPCGEEGGPPPPPPGPQNVTVTGNDVTSNWFIAGQEVVNGSTINLRPGDTFSVVLDPNSSFAHGLSMSKPVDDIWENASGLFMTEPTTFNGIFTTILAVGALAGQQHVSTSNLGFTPPATLFAGTVKADAAKGPFSVACSVHGPVAMFFIVNIL